MLPALLSTVLGVLLALPQPSLAASGGRIGGGSFRSAPSMPRSYGGGYRGGYGGGVQRGYGGGFGGGLGFPFIVPFFFGGGGLFGFLVLMAVVGLLVNALRGGGGPALPAGMRGGDLDRPQADGPVAVAQLQVGLLASARELQRDLRNLAGQADTRTNSGLQRVLQESTLALLRHPDLWVYANAEVGQVPFAAAESTFNRLSMTERSKLRSELTSNVAGSVSQAPAAGESDATSDYIAVTLLVASRGRIPLKPVSGSEELREALRVLGSVPSDQLLALEVIWQPEGAGEVLSADELITAYPDLKHL
ncbi:DUF1517 domain-containing protein [Vulcanococcus sp.]|jgi:uncharacterized membrane protein|uniref:DUF1517 domain-containing protein n=1 Tax=Vulcanococcus sp. TaxID=2856995 RepID=UPI0037D9FB84